MTIEIRRVDWSAETERQAVLNVLDAYSRHEFGMGKPLPDDIRERLLPELEKRETSLVLLAWDGTEPVGIANCFFGFSSFAARPLLNVHDLAVVDGRRGQGIGRQLLAEAEVHARRAGCCRLTLEVRRDNERALGLYQSFGLDHYRVDGVASPTYFLGKAISD